MKLRITVEGKQYEVEVEVLEQGAASPPAEETQPTNAAAQSPAASPSTTQARGAAPQKRGKNDQAATAGEVKAPVAGSVFDVKVKAGDQVQKNDTLLVLEAMKMESNVPAPQAGTVQEVLVEVGQQVTAGQVLVRLA